jgi:hypothetical protein
MAADFLQTYLHAGVVTGQPHLAPVNAAAVSNDCATVLQRAVGLNSYQAYLTAARSAKAQKKGATLSFERTVQMQAAQAFDDAQSLSGAALRVIQQVNQTAFWAQTMGRMTTTLGTTGPVTAQQIWNDVWVGQSDPNIRLALQAAGMTDAVAAAVTINLAQVNAGYMLQNGKLAIQSGPTGEPAATRIALKVPGSCPANIGELLGAGAFDQVTAAFAGGASTYLEVVPAAIALEPAHLFAAGAIAARQHVADHLRKLQDSGLATQAGAGPLTIVLVTLLVSALVIGAIGVGILIECDNAESQGKEPPGGKDLCAIGEILVYLAMLMLEVAGEVAGSGVIQAIAVLAFGGLMSEFVANFNEIMPTFTPGMAPNPPPQ